MAEAEAGITIAESQLNRAKNALARIEGLRDTASFSSSRFDDAQSDFFQAEGETDLPTTPSIEGRIKDSSGTAYRVPRRNSP